MSRTTRRRELGADSVVRLTGRHHTGTPQPLGAVLVTGRAHVGTGALARPPSEARLDRQRTKPEPVTVPATRWPCETTSARADADILAWWVFCRESSAPTPEPRPPVPETEEIARNGNKSQRSWRSASPRETW